MAKKTKPVAGKTKPRPNPGPDEPAGDDGILTVLQNIHNELQRITEAIRTGVAAATNPAAPRVSVGAVPGGTTYLSSQWKRRDGDHHAWVNPEGADEPESRESPQGGRRVSPPKR